MASGALGPGVSAGLPARRRSCNGRGAIVSRMRSTHGHPRRAAVWSPHTLVAVDPQPPQPPAPLQRSIGPLLTGLLTPAQIGGLLGFLFEWMSSLLLTLTKGEINRVGRAVASTSQQRGRHHGAISPRRQGGQPRSAAGAAPPCDPSGHWPRERGPAGKASGRSSPIPPTAADLSSLERRSPGAPACSLPPRPRVA